MANQEQLLNEFIGKLEHIIQSNLGNPAFSIEQICTEMNVSRAQMHRKVKVATGLSTSLFIRQMRMEQAKLLLNTTSLNVSEVAYQVGITSPQNFSKYFIETYGISPSAYRKQQDDSSKALEHPPVLTVPAPEASDIPVPTAFLRRRCWVPVGLLLIVGIGISVWIGLYHQKDRLTATAHPTLLLLPFEHQATASDSFWSTGIREDVLLRLKQVESLTILPVTSVEADTGDSEATTWKSDYQLEGEWTLRQQKPRLTVRLIQRTNHRKIWEKRYHDYESNPAAIAGNIAAQVARVLKRPLSDELAQRIQYQATSSAQAYQRVLRGNYLLKSRTQESLQESLQHFEQAIQLDSAYSDAYLGKANALSLMVNMSYSNDEKNDLRQAEQLALLAIKTNTNNAAAYAILANVYREQFRWQESLTTYQIALKLNPNDVFTNYWYSLALRSTGNLKQALHYHKIAYEFDPTHPIIFSGYVYTAIFAKDFKLAAALLEQRAADFKQSFVYWMLRGNFYLAQAEYEAALTCFNTSLALNAHFKSAQSARIFCLGKLGKRQEVATFIASLDTTRAEDCLTAAVAYAGLGEIEKGIWYLKSAADKGKIPEYLIVDMRYAPLQVHPAFRQILEAYGLKPILE